MPRRTSTLWQSEDLVRIIPGRPVGGTFVCRHISIDSRTLQPGDAFVALRGPNFDGHDYIKDAITQGASGIITEQTEVINYPQIVVSDTYLCLWKIATAARRRFRGKVIAITGSVGKTSLKDMVRHAFSSLHAVYSSPGNFNNDIGVPLSWCNCPEDMDFAVMELGMNKPGEISSLSHLSRPHLAALTPIGRAHMGNFSNPGEIVTAKLEILAGLERGSSVIVAQCNPKQDKRIRDEVAEKELSFFDVGPSADSSIRVVSATLNRKQTVYTLEFEGQTYSGQLGAPGTQWPLLAGLVAGIGHRLGVADMPVILKALSSYRPLPGRGVPLGIAWGDKHLTVLDESYNASPESMLKMVDTVNQIKAERTLLVLGEMLELGVAGAEEHRKLAMSLERSSINELFCCGEAMKHIVSALGDSSIACHYFKDADDLWEGLRLCLRDGDFLAVKGSHAMGMQSIIDHLLP